ncbi:hypothetical protein HAX54_033721, partial [Datura stramonium]|nr:hypothetical protein [Datura stramonium]
KRIPRRASSADFAGSYRHSSALILLYHVFYVKLSVSRLTIHRRFTGGPAIRARCPSLGPLYYIDNPGGHGFSLVVHRRVHWSLPPAFFFALAFNGISPRTSDLSIPC